MGLLTRLFSRSRSRRRETPITREQRDAELVVIQAVSSIVAGKDLLPRWQPPATHRLRGLTGLRAWQMMAAHAAWRSNEPGLGTTLLETVRVSLMAELTGSGQPDGPTASEAAHLRKLLAFATGLWAFRSAQAKLAGHPADREKVIRESRTAADMMRTEPYLRYLQAETLLLLGETEELAAELKPLAQAPWLGGWKESFNKLLNWNDLPERRYRIAQAMLPSGTPDVRLRAMSGLPGWLDQAGPDLPGLLDAEAAGTPSLKPLYRFELFISKHDFPDDAAVDRLIGSVDSPDEPTLLGLLAALKQRFGILLYPRRPERTDSLKAGRATAAFDGRTVATASAADLAQAHDGAHWWPGLATAPVALRVLMVASLRMLHRCQLSDAGLPATERETQALMLADRMAYRPREQRARMLLAEGTDPASTVAALRLSSGQGIDPEPLWGAEPWRDLVLLDAETEQACSAGMIADVGLAMAPDIVARFARILRARIGSDQRQEKQAVPSELVRIGSYQHQEKQAAPSEPVLIGSDQRQEEQAAPSEPALVVRDPALRPLLRALLRDTFPDLPVLAMAEVESRTLAVLDVSERAAA